MARQTLSKERLIEATINVVRAKGYNATRIEDVCAAAGVTKGSFFHHFASKEEVALAAAGRWQSYAAELFTEETVACQADPLDRLLAYIDLRKRMMAGDLAEWTCFAGTTIQETYATHPDLRDACGRTIVEHSASIADMIAEAMRQRGVGGDGWTAESLALLIQTVLQGAFVLAKATDDAAVATDSVDHLRRYVESLFAQGEACPAGRR